MQTIGSVTPSVCGASHSRRLRLAEASPHERDAIARARHEVYATELKQYAVTPGGSLPDDPRVACTYLVATLAGRLAGFVGVTCADSPRLSIDNYVPRSAVPVVFDGQLFEIRALTVLRAQRGFLLAGALMYAALRWVEAHGGTRILAVGRREVLDMYRRVGLRPLGPSFISGAVSYDVIGAAVSDVRTALQRFAGRLRRLSEQVDWQLTMPFATPADCHHGGAFFQAIGEEFDDLERRKRVISADVLDAWFPPAPGVEAELREHLAWAIATSPPTHAAGLARVIARARGVPPASILPGGGSSPLIFLGLREWLRPRARVLVLDPTYGEYAHVLEHVIGCQVTRLALARGAGYALAPDALARALAKGFDGFMWVNPNSPTGRHFPRELAAQVLAEAPPQTRVWIDETYVDYMGPEESWEPLAVQSAQVVVCKSMSKTYALSGLRVGYLCGSPAVLDTLRPLVAPWSVGLVAQIAATCALQDPGYYAQRYAETRLLRRQLDAGLAALGIAERVPGEANFIMFHLPGDGPDAASVAAACRGEGLYLRDVSNAATEVGRHALRMAVKDAETNGRMLKILGRVLRG